MLWLQALTLVSGRVKAVNLLAKQLSPFVQEINLLAQQLSLLTHQLSPVEGVLATEVPLEGSVTTKGPVAAEGLDSKANKDSEEFPVTD